jgi:hypothetical protein
MASFMSALVDALNAVACVVATAVVVALAYPLVIPISVVLDYLVNGIPIKSWGLLGWIGTISVIVGVFCLEVPGSDEDDDNASKTRDPDDYNSIVMPTVYNGNNSERTAEGAEGVIA